MIKRIFDAINWPIVLVYAGAIAFVVYFWIIVAKLMATVIGVAFQF